MVTSLVLPVSRGETPLQQYNTVLCLDSIAQTADCVLYSLNEQYSEDLLKINLILAEEKAQLLSLWERTGQTHFGSLLEIVAGSLNFARAECVGKLPKLKGMNRLIELSKQPGKERSLLLRNTGEISNYLVPLLQSAREKIESKAYLHWYDQWNAVDRLREGLLRLWDVTDAYQDFR